MFESRSIVPIAIWFVPKIFNHHNFFVGLSTKNLPLSILYVYPLTSKFYLYPNISCLYNSSMYFGGVTWRPFIINIQVLRVLCYKECIYLFFDFLFHALYMAWWSNLWPMAMYSQEKDRCNLDILFTKF